MLHTIYGCYRTIYCSAAACAMGEGQSGCRDRIAQSAWNGQPLHYYLSGAPA
ncbi:hypothetical protein ABID26_002478 [Mesorhizobium shonense]|uniref:Uncharacterized protein n=1 Tax=Mesorhizobium shonense TaxID=1209948 RepID=A0ABV2HR68_9HYPH|nr:hypothetical protein [Mesorhizobium sp.]